MAAGRPELVAAREQQPGGDIPYLEKVIAEYNPKNYEFKEHPRGISIEFVPPDELRKRESQSLSVVNGGCA